MKLSERPTWGRGDTAGGTGLPGLPKPWAEMFTSSAANGQEENGILCTILSLSKNAAKHSCGPLGSTGIGQVVFILKCCLL